MHNDRCVVAPLRESDDSVGEIPTRQLTVRTVVNGTVKFRGGT